MLSFCAPRVDSALHIVDPLHFTLMNAKPVSHMAVTVKRTLGTVSPFRSAQIGAIPPPLMHPVDVSDTYSAPESSGA